jgi:hypothetical protein
MKLGLQKPLTSWVIVAGSKDFSNLIPQPFSAKTSSLAENAFV